VSRLKGAWAGDAKVEETIAALPKEFVRGREHGRQTGLRLWEEETSAGKEIAKRTTMTRSLSQWPKRRVVVKKPLQLT
jgi:hypothetical protein